MSQITDQEIDLRPYAKALYKALPWIVLASILMGLAGYLFSGFATPIFEASTLIALREPLYTLEFDSRIQVAEEDVSSIYDALPIIATSDGVLSALLQDETLFPDSGTEIDSLRRSLSTEPLARPSLIQLSASSQDPERAAELVNAWSILLVNRANAVFSGQGTSQSVFFGEQLAQSEQELRDAESELEAYAAQNEGAALASELEVLLETQGNYLRNQSQLDVLLQDATSLSAQLEGRAQSDIVSPEDRLAALLLQVRTFSGQTELPLQLQLGGTDNSEQLTVDEQRAYLAALVKVLTEKSADIDSKLAELTPEILRIQQKVQTFDTEQQRLEDAAEIARDTHTILARKTKESAIASQDVSGVIQMVSRATTPTNPASPNKLVNAIAAAALGFLIAVTVVLFMHGQSQDEPETKEQQAT